MALERLDTGIEYHYGVIEHLHRYAVSKGICSEKIVLDLASGEGYGSNLLSNYAKEVIGVDIPLLFSWCFVFIVQVCCYNIPGISNLINPSIF